MGEMEKETTVGMILNHTSGLPAFKTPVQEGVFMTGNTW